MPIERLKDLDLSSTNALKANASDLVTKLRSLIPLNHLLTEELLVLSADKKTQIVTRVFPNQKLVNIFASMETLAKSKRLKVAGEIAPFWYLATRQFQDNRSAAVALPLDYPDAPLYSRGIELEMVPLMNVTSGLHAANSRSRDDAEGYVAEPYSENDLSQIEIGIAGMFEQSIKRADKLEIPFAGGIAFTVGTEDGDDLTRAVLREFAVGSVYQLHGFIPPRKNDLVLYFPQAAVDDLV